MQKSGKKAPNAEVARLPLGFPERQGQASSFMSKEELVSLLLRRGFDVSSDLVNAMRTPANLFQGKYERYEFFDCSSFPQPFPYHDSDSPARCIEAKAPAPAWIKEWYMAITEEGGQAYLILVFKPRDLFVKCPFEHAGFVIPEEMRSHAQNR